ncbi:hypothetical protein ACIF2S_16970 [Pseudomonas taetrolens]|uniref:hypothetical protein n=1 Tax=Pseudomonas taetrolens TaxID=47884 RepID=UPI0037CC95CB
MLERFHAWAAKAQPYALPYWRFNPGLQQLQCIVGLSQPCVGLQRFGKPQAPTLLLGIQAARELGTARVIDQRQDNIPLSRLSKGDMKYDRIWLAWQAGSYAEGLAQINVRVMQQGLSLLDRQTGERAGEPVRMCMAPAIRPPPGPVQGVSHGV